MHFQPNTHMVRYKLDICVTGVRDNKIMAIYWFSG